MLPRLLNLPKNQSFFLFGARGTGKSTLLKQQFLEDKSLWIDLLDPEEEDRYLRNPKDLYAEVTALPKNISHVILDEIQKIPKLLDVIHKLIEETSKKFVMTGSSARKLKHGSANLLAGRAFVYDLFPFAFLELKKKFHLEDALKWGMLPKIHVLNDSERYEFLKAYASTYLKEEIWGEHLIRKLEPFRRFLEVAAQANGKIINYSNIARDVGVDDKTIKDYFFILEDTLIGFFLEPFHHSFRKRLSTKPKFYFFDVGIARTLAGQISIPLQAQTSVYGEIFEHFIILECMKLCSYHRKDVRFSYLRTKDDVEIDLVVERPGKQLLFIEIKSKTSVTEQDLHTLIQIKKDFPKAEFVCFSQDRRKKIYDSVTIWPWQEGVSHYFW